MTGLGAVLLALGLADLLAGELAGEPTSRGRVLWSLIFALLTLALTCWITGLGLRSWCKFFAPLMVLSCPWLFLRIQDSASHSAHHEVSVTKLWWALGFLGGTLVIALALSGVFRPTGDALLGAALQTLEIPALRSLNTDRFVFLVGSSVFLVASTNGIVRAVLGVAGTDIERSQQRLRGGRLIGPIERLLIYGLAVVGEPTAAALIVSAKSLLRFPELSRVARKPDDTCASVDDPGADDTSKGTRADESRVTEVDYVTEYFLLGSLVSWFVALVLALLIHKP